MMRAARQNSGSGAKTLVDRVFLALEDLLRRMNNAPGLVLGVPCPLYGVPSRGKSAFNRHHIWCRVVWHPTRCPAKRML